MPDHEGTTLAYWQSPPDAIRSSGRIGRYLWVLSQFAGEGLVLTTSRDISAASGINATQVRRDLSTLLGRTGKRGVGYNVRRLLEALRSQTTFGVRGDGPIAAALVASPTLALLGIVQAAKGAVPDVAILDYTQPDGGRAAARVFAHDGVKMIVSYGHYLIDAPPARVIHVSPILALAEAIA